jgi:hypothetical protein
LGIKIEFNPDLALRNIAEFKAGKRKEVECIPEKLENGKIFEFLKEGQRNYWLEGEIPLVETKGNQQLSRPLASIVIIEATHLALEGKLFTKGKYKVIDVFNPKGKKIYFEAMARIK